MLFPFLDLKAEYALMKAEIQDAVGTVLESQRFIMGPQVRELEAEVAALVGCKFAMGCASGSDALLLALMALDIGSGDEVITQPFTFVATAGSIARLKAKPVFVDIDPETNNLDARQLESAITGKTRAIMPVHLRIAGRNGRIIGSPRRTVCRSSRMPPSQSARSTMGRMWATSASLAASASSRRRIWEEPGMAA